MGDGIVLYISRTRSGVKCQYRDYNGLADGIFSKGYVRYFYDENALEKAFDYADRKAEKFDDYSVEAAPYVERPGANEQREQQCTAANSGENK